MHRCMRWSFGCTAALTFLLVLLLPHRSAAQSPPSRPPAPVARSLTTKDGVELQITYYPSNAGRDAVPVVMIPDFNETRAVFDSFARSLQNPPPAEGRGPAVASRAVITVDLRGHGDSKSGFDPSGAPFQLDAQRLKRDDYRDMVEFDMEAVRSFLVDENDAQRLNLNRLCVLGSGMGANVAVLWAANDWAAPPLAVLKQGQDVKALVLLSPKWSFQGLNLVNAFKFPPIQRAISIFLAFGAADKAADKDGRNIDKILIRNHPEPPADQAAAVKDYYLFAPQTSLQGTRLLTSREFSLAPRIAEFIELRVGAKAFPYLKRRN